MIDAVNFHILKNTKQRGITNIKLFKTEIRMIDKRRDIPFIAGGQIIYAYNLWMTCKKSIAEM